MSDERPSADQFGRLASELHEVDGVEETAEAVVQFALQAVWCRYASVVLIANGRRPQLMALTDPKLAALYHLQIDAGAGPLITAIQDESVLLIPDVHAETRWSPEWIQQLTAAGIRSAVHLPLHTRGRSTAVLSLYSDQPDAFNVDDLAVAHILAPTRVGRGRQCSAARLNGHGY